MNIIKFVEVIKVQIFGHYSCPALIQIVGSVNTMSSNLLSTLAMLCCILVVGLVYICVFMVHVITLYCSYT